MIDSGFSGNQARCVFVGEVGAGKSTALSAVGFGDVMSMDVPLSEEVEIEGKTTTTVGFDFVLLNGGSCPLYLYGAPGQGRFDFVLAELLQGALGAVLLLNASGSDPVAMLKEWLNKLLSSNSLLPVIVAVNRVGKNGPSLEDLRRVAGSVHPRCFAIQHADPRNRAEMLGCLRLLTLFASDGLTLDDEL